MPSAYFKTASIHKASQSRRADQVLPGHVILFNMAKLILDQHSYPEKLSEYWHRFGMIQPTTQQRQNSTSIP